MTRLKPVWMSRRVAGLLLVVLALSGILPWMGWFPPAGADPVGPVARDRQIAVTVTTMLSREHLLRHPFDAEIAHRCMTMFLKMLDPMKVYFYQSDADSFFAREREVEGLRRGGNVKLAYDIFGTLLKRIDERVQMVDQLLAAPQDFTAEEEMLIDRDMAQYAKTPEEAVEKWRKRIKYDLLSLKADADQKKKKKKKDTAAPQPGDAEPKATPADEDPIARLKRRYHFFSKRMHQTDNDELLEMYLTSLSESFDPHTSYMSPATVENFDIQMGLKLEGIGASLQSVDGYTVVNKLVPGGAAEKDGHLKVEDRIVGVGQGTSGPVEDVMEMKLTDVVKLIRGPRGTVVRLEVMAPHGTDRRVIAITRAQVELKDSEARAKVFEAGRKPDGQPYKIGVIDLPSFYMDMVGARAGLPNFKSTTRDVRRILDEFNRTGIDALILDLRRNGGGSLQEAISLTGMFVGDGPVVQVKDADGRIQPFNDPDGAMVWKGPMAVLISKFSASASEILAGAIQDYHRGLIIGDHSTHGKGTVQTMMDLSESLFRMMPNSPKLGALKITMQQFYRPNGDSTQRRGVLADIELPSLTTHLDVGEADLDYPVAFDQIRPARFKPMNFVNRDLITRLAQLSEARCRTSEDFQKVLKNITRYQEQKKRKFVTLNEKKFMEERAELNADKEEEKKIEEMSESGSNEIKRDYYLNEDMAIMLDYIQLLSAPPAAQAVQAVRPAAP